MWSAVKNEVSSQDIKNEHFRIIEKALEDAETFDVRTTELYTTLDELQKKSSRSSGFSLFREGLENNNLEAMYRGYQLIRKHLGENE